ncbi:kinase-like domain-containing protein [Mycena belliarum]|uniref:Kinase-like domain-containing protein n=1 Tax=Mycena belliarum TaxID=1033014 RepID=A0AAD6XUI6_9AGAR|nr:kinase-like domain-containing protein [Mycena belliae]
MQRFVRETAILQSLRHPRILPFMGVLDDPGRLCIVTPWMDFGELNTYLRTHPYDPRRPLARQVFEGLLYLRSKRIVHGDMKGANILVDLHGCAHIADLGSARIVSLQGHDSQTVPWGKRPLASGTYRWMAPELLVDNAPGLSTFESDIFAFGMVFGGRIPFHHLEPMAANIEIIQGHRPTRPASTPNDIWTLATACWDDNPARRPAISSVVI